MTRRTAKVLARAIAFWLALATSLTPGLVPGSTGEARAVGHGGFHGGGHFGGGHFGGFHGGHFGGGHFGGFHGGRFGGGHFGGFHGGHFGGGHFGGFHGGRLGGGHFGGFHGGRLGGGHFGGRHFGGSHFANAHFGGHQLGRAGWAGHGLGGAAGRAAFAHDGAGGGLGRFGGAEGFGSHGFGRNAFGNRAEWNAWGDHYRGAGWNNWGGGWGYWAGPVFWPFLYGDALTFALWPYAFYDPFFGYGSDLLFTSIFWPGPWSSPYYADYPYSYYGYGPYGYGATGPFDIYGSGPTAGSYAYDGYTVGRHRHHHHRPLYAARSPAPTEPPAAPDTAAACAGLAPGIVAFPIDRIERAIGPTDAQVAMLGDLQSASTRAENILRASCSTEVPLTPVARLDAVAKRIRAMSEAVQTVRAPLTALYESLDDEQKDRFEAIGSQTGSRRGRNARQESPGGNLGGLCKLQAEGFTHLPVQRIDEVIKPTAEQKPAFDALKSASDKAAASLDTSCPAEIPGTLTGRLDAIAARLTALAGAVEIVRPALVDFYGALSDEQKARFNLIGRISPAEAPRGETKSGG